MFAARCLEPGVLFDSEARGGFSSFAVPRH